MKSRPLSVLCKSSVAILAVTAVAGVSSSVPMAAAAAPATTLVVAEAVSPTTLDPQASPFINNNNEEDLSYQCLLQTSNAGVIVPELATSYTVSSNGLYYTFNLRHGVLFQNGDQMTSADVVYTYKRLFATGSPTLQQIYTNFKGNVVAEGPYTVKFTLTAPDAGFPGQLGTPLVQGCGIMNEAAVKAGNIATTMVGTGPWQEVSYTPNVSLIMKRFSGYWGTKTTEPNLEVEFVPESETQVADFDAGDIDIIMPPQSSVSGLEKNSSVVVKGVASDTLTGIEFNYAVPPFNNVNARRAVALALNRNALAAVSYQGAATPSSFVPPGYSWGTPLSKLPYSQPNTVEAKKLLAAAGYPNGLKVTLQYITAYDWGTNALVAQEQSELSAVGIDATLVPEQTATWFQDNIATHTNFTLGWNAWPYQGDPEGYTQIYAFEDDPGRGPVPPGLQALIKKELDATSSSQFHAAINAVEADEDSLVYPRLPLLTTNTFVAYHKGVTNVVVPASETTQFLSAVGKP